MSAVHELPGFAGELIRPGEAAYDEARRVWNAMHDRRPALVARCRTPEDVAAAIALGRARGWPIAVRGGGHSMPGHSTCDDGLVIDLRPLSRIEVDPARRRVVVGGGALLGELDRATQEHGLVVPAGVVSHTGVGGLTLGGGLGRLMRRFGLTIDSLLECQVVLADGRIVRTSADELPDLFWALRGGGGNFGVVTEFTFRLHDLRNLLILGAFHAGTDAARVLGHAERTMAATPPDELLWTSFLRLAPPLPWMPPGIVGTPGVMSLIEWSGDLAAGQPVLERIAGELPSPIAQSIDPVRFLDIQTMTDEIFAHGKRTYIKAGYADALTPELIAALCRQGAEVGSEFSQIEVLAQGGAIGRVAPEATAYPHRDARWLLNVPATWIASSDDEREIAWARSSHAALAPHLRPGAYVNFMDGDEAAGAGTSGATLERLTRVKRIYDPENVFRLNQNIVP